MSRNNHFKNVVGKTDLSDGEAQMGSTVSGFPQGSC